MADEIEPTPAPNDLQKLFESIRASLKSSNIVDSPDSPKEIERLQKEEYEEKIEGLKQDRAERKKYALRYYLLVVGWLLAVIALLAFNKKLCLGENVLLMLLGTTTANIVAVLILVAKYLFPAKSR